MSEYIKYHIMKKKSGLITKYYLYVIDVSFYAKTGRLWCLEGGPEIRTLHNELVQIKKEDIPKIHREMADAAEEMKSPTIKGCGVFEIGKKEEPKIKEKAIEEKLQELKEQEVDNPTFSIHTQLINKTWEAVKDSRYVMEDEETVCYDKALSELFCSTVHKVCNYWVKDENNKE